MLLTKELLVQNVMWMALEQYVMAMGGYTTQHREIGINLENVGRRGVE